MLCPSVSLKHAAPHSYTGKEAHGFMICHFKNNKNVSFFSDYFNNDGFIQQVFSTLPEVCAHRWTFMCSFYYYFIFLSFSFKTGITNLKTKLKMMNTRR